MSGNEGLSLFSYRNAFSAEQDSMDFGSVLFYAIHRFLEETKSDVPADVSKLSI